MLRGHEILKIQVCIHLTTFVSTDFAIDTYHPGKWLWLADFLFQEDQTLQPHPLYANSLMYQSLMADQTVKPLTHLLLENVQP